MHANLAAGVSFSETIGSIDYVRIKPAGNQTGLPAAHSISAVNMPDFGLDAMFPDDPSIQYLIGLDAHSSGNDLVPHLSSTAPYVPDLQGNWMSGAISVRNNTTGENDSHWHRRSQAPAGRSQDRGADIVSYYYDSEGVAPRLRNTTIVEQLAEDIAVPIPTTPGQQRDVDALDWAIGIVTEMQEVELNGLIFDDVNTFYFSLTPDCVNTINGFYPTNGFVEFATDSGSPNGWAPAHEATIYRIVWDGFAWSHPDVLYDYETLGLNHQDNIDAVSVNKENGVVIFSTQPEVGRSQILAYDPQLALPAPQVGAVPLYTNSTPPVLASTAFGLRPTGQEPPSEEPDDTDAICFTEPEPFAYSRYLGITLTTLFTGNPMGMAVTRTIGSLATDNDQLVEEELICMQASGWGTGKTPRAGQVLFVALDPRNGYNFDQAQLLGMVDRTATQDTVELRIPAEDLPTSLSPMSGAWAPPAILAAFLDGTTIELSWVTLIDN